MKRIPVNTPDISAAARESVVSCLAAGWISSEGPQVRTLEELFAATHGREHGVAVSSGTAALDVAVRALGIGAGDEVLVPSLTIISCGRAIVQAGAKPIPVDCSPLDWNAHLKDFEERLTAKTKAIVLVHLYGLCADLDPIISWARHHNLAVIEDASQALGLRYRGRLCGGFGDISLFSLYANKLITTGEGGMILCDSGEVAERCRALRNLCFEPKRRFWHQEIGWNYRMTALQAALGIPQVQILDELAMRKVSIGRRYRDELAQLQSFRMAPRELSYVSNGYWAFGLVVQPDASFGRDDVVEFLSLNEIESRTFFYGLHQQPALLLRHLIDPVSLPVTESLSRSGFYLPSGLGLPEEDQSRIIHAMLAFAGDRG